MEFLENDEINEFIETDEDGLIILTYQDQFESNGISIGNWRIDERDGQRYQVFFVAAPDGLVTAVALISGA